MCDLTKHLSHSPMKHRHRWRKGTHTTPISEHLNRLRCSETRKSCILQRKHMESLPLRSGILLWGSTFRTICVHMFQDYVPVLRVLQKGLWKWNGKVQGQKNLQGVNYFWIAILQIMLCFFLFCFRLLLPSSFSSGVRTNVHKWIKLPVLCSQLRRTRILNTCEKHFQQKWLHINQ